MRPEARFISIRRVISTCIRKSQRSCGDESLGRQLLKFVSHGWQVPDGNTGLLGALADHSNRAQRHVSCWVHYMASDKVVEKTRLFGGTTIQAVRNHKNEATRKTLTV